MYFQSGSDQVQIKFICIHSMKLLIFAADYVQPP